MTVLLECADCLAWKPLTDFNRGRSATDRRAPKRCAGCQDKRRPPAPPQSRQRDHGERKCRQCGRTRPVRPHFMDLNGGANRVKTCDECRRTS